MGILPVDNDMDSSFNTDKLRPQSVNLSAIKEVEDEADDLFNGQNLSSLATEDIEKYIEEANEELGDEPDSVHSATSYRP